MPRATAKADAASNAKSGDEFDMHSAGTEPGSALNEESRDSMAQLGANFEGEYPKAVELDLLNRATRTVIVGAGAHVEPVPGMVGEVEAWDAAEPSLRGIEGEERMNMICNELGTRVRELFATLHSKQQ